MAQYDLIFSYGTIFSSSSLAVLLRVVTTLLRIRLIEKVSFGTVGAHPEESLEALQIKQDRGRIDVEIEGAEDFLLDSQQVLTIQ